MAEKPVIHIHAGLPKTGSSALQMFLELNAERLAGRGLLVPETGRTEGGAHHTLFFELAGLDPFARGAALRELELEIRESGLGQVLISSEFAYGCLRWGFAGRALRKLARRGFEIRFNFFVRPQPDFATSAHPEFLRNMVYGARFIPFLEENFLPFAADYREFLTRFDRLGAAPTIVIPYNRASRVEGVWWTLLSAIGHGVPAAERTGFEAPGEVNRSLGPVAVSALTNALVRIEKEGLIRRWGHRKAVRTALLFETRHFQQEDERYNPLSPAAREKLWNRVAEANDAFAEQVWNQRWKERFPSEAMTRPGRLVYRRWEDEDGPTADYHDWMSRRLYRKAKQKITAVEENARAHGPIRRLRRAFGRPVDRLADRVMRSILKGG